MTNLVNYNTCTIYVFSRRYARYALMKEGAVMGQVEVSQLSSKLSRSEVAKPGPVRSLVSRA